MHLIQILLPLYDNDGIPFPQKQYLEVRDELTEHFGGVTGYLRSPAEGLWRETPSTTVRDEIVIYEVMTGQLDRNWWRSYRARTGRTLSPGDAGGAGKRNTSALVPTAMTNTASILNSSNTWLNYMNKIDFVLFV